LFHRILVLILLGFESSHMTIFYAVFIYVLAHLAFMHHLTISKLMALRATRSKGIAYILLYSIVSYIRDVRIRSMSSACWNLEMIITLIIACIISYQCKLWIVLAEFEITILHLWLAMLVRMSQMSTTSFKSFRSIRIWRQFDRTNVSLTIHYDTWEYNVLWVFSHLNLILILTRILSVTSRSKCKSLSVLRILFILM